MFSVLTAYPTRSLHPFVSHYIQREVSELGKAAVEPVPARIQNIWEFQFRDRYEIRYFDSEGIDVGPRTALVGPQTYRRARLTIHGRMEGFIVVFTATGFYRLFGVDMSKLVNQAHDAPSVLGAEAGELWERLGEAASFARRIEILEEFLIPYTAGAPLGVSRLTNHTVAHSGAVRISDLARHSGLSGRQLERRFLAQVGMSPKAFARIQRYESALRMKLAVPKQPWSAVAHELGYCDQMHMVHDFHNLSGEAPARTLARVSYGLSLRPQAWFDLSELTG